jgi:hypothetical protein
MNMKRRSLLAALFAAPIIPAVAKAAAPRLGMEAPEQHPFEFESGLIRMHAADISEIEAGALRSADRRMSVDLAAGHVTILD